MTTDPTQPDSQETTVSAASSDDATSQVAAAAVTPVAEATSDSESVGARIREKMSAATEALPQPEETVSAPAARRGPVEIPKEDDLEAGLEAEIAAASLELFGGADHPCFSVGSLSPESICCCSETFVRWLLQ